MDWLVLVGFALGSYLLGSINTSVLISRLAGKGDVRKVGSGNPGATNTLRLLGRGWAVTVLLIDGGRGAGVLLLAEWLIPGVWQPYAASFGVVLGNLFPVFHGFRGGKGVATTLGVFVALDPIAAGIGLGVWLVLVALTRLASLGSICMVASYPVSLHLLGQAWGAVAFGGLMWLTVLFTHRENLGRLARGEEHKLGAKREGAAEVES